MSAPTIYRIASRHGFTDALAAGLLARFEGDPLGLADAQILVPTRRAARALRDAFLKVTGRPMLLPRLRPIGDIDEDGLQLGNDLEGGDLDLPPAITDLHRQLLLARLIGEWRAARGEDRLGDIAQGVALAGELARLMDQIETERLPLAGLADLVPAEYAAHWRITLDFLAILSDHWPRIIGELGLMTPAARRNRLIDRQAESWRANPPTGAVIAAGSTGSIPATAALLGVIARLPEGAIVLPGLDLELDDESWQALGPCHSQATMKQLLDRLDAGRGDVIDWPFPGSGGRGGAREALLRDSLRPAETTDAWQRLAPVSPVAVEGLARLDAPTPRHEAGVIALMMRRALSRDGETAALVTPDRKLARRVAGELRRWGIRVDDSAGEPLAQTGPGAFLRLLAVAASTGAPPAALLACLKHPLATMDQAPSRFREMTRRLEKRLLRGPRPAPGFDGLLADLDGRRDSDRELARWLRRLADGLAPLTACLDRTSITLAELLAAHVATAEWLAAGPDATADDGLWAGEAGQVAAEFVAGLGEAAVAADLDIAGNAYPALLERLMTGRVVRPRFGLHPRLHIWGPLEARMQRADLLILGGLNEGTWPTGAGADPWLSRRMRTDFELPSPERRIGLAAHDFAQAANAPRVVLTRAEKVGGTPTLPSRWLQRLHNVLGGIPAPSEPWLDWLAALDRPERVTPVAPPVPRPPLAARPARLSVTQVETWMRDPYAVYARHVLDLRPLDPIDADPGAAEHGIFVHRALDAFIKAYPEALPGDALERLIDCGREALGAALERPAVRAFWWPRFHRIARWFIDHERTRRLTARPLASEVPGKMELDQAASRFTLIARADRIDRLADGTLAIIDYKTGLPPSTKRIEAGYAPQMPLEAMMAIEGAFKGIAPAAVGELAFWRLSGRDPAATVVPVKLDIAEAADQARRGLLGLIAAFTDPATPYLSTPRPEMAGYGEYDHLARVKEWTGGGS